jgi:hypothetical protein
MLQQSERIELDTHWPLIAASILGAWPSALHHTQCRGSKLCTASISTASCAIKRLNFILLRTAVDIPSLAGN